jgi:hypothetical protein
MSDQARSSKKPPGLWRDLGLVGVMIAVAVMCWAGYTTWSGMSQLMQNPFGAVIGTAAVVIVLALASWVLGRDLAILLLGDRRNERPPTRKVITTFLVFLFVFAISAFFSYTYYYQTVSSLGGTQATAEEQPRLLAEQIAPELKAVLDQTYKTGSDALAADQTIKAWADAITKIREKAGQSGEAFQKKLAEIRAAGEAAQQKLAGLMASKKAVETKIEGYTKQIQEIDAQLAQLGPQRDAAEDRYKQACAGKDGTNKAQCGPIARAAEAEKKSLESRIAGLQGTKKTLEQKRSDAQTDLDKVNAAIETANGDLVRAGASGAAASTSLADPRAAVEALARAQNEFIGDPTRAHLAAAIQLCEPILQALRAAGLDPGAGIECGSKTESLARLMEQRQRTVDAVAKFNAECTLDPNHGLDNLARELRASVHDRKIEPADALPKMQTKLEECIEIARQAGVPERTLQGYSGELLRFVDSNRLNANKFELARRVIFSFSPDSTLALGIAFAQDSFILLLKLFTELFGHQPERRGRRRMMGALDLTDRPEEPAELRAAKALLRLQQTGEDGRSSIELGSAGFANLPEDVRINLRGHLQRMAREGHARWNKKAAAFVIEDQALAELEAELRQAKPDTPNERGASPGASTAPADTHGSLDPEARPATVAERPDLDGQEAATPLRVSAWESSPGIGQQMTPDIRSSASSPGEDEDEWKAWDREGEPEPDTGITDGDRDVPEGDRTGMSGRADKRPFARLREETQRERKIS